MTTLTSTVGVVVPILAERWPLAKNIVNEVPRSWPLVLVIDDEQGCIDEQELSALPSNASVVYSGGTRLGVSNARNIGIDFLAKLVRFALMHDDDDSFEADLYREYFRHLTANPTTGLIYLAKDELGISVVERETCDRSGQSHYPLSTHLARSGAGLCVDVSVHQKVSGFDQNLRKHEDREYLIRYLAGLGPRSVYSAPCHWLKSAPHDYERLSNLTIVKASASAEALRRLAKTASQYPTPKELIPILSGRVASECAKAGDYRLALEVQRIGNDSFKMSFRQLKRLITYRLFQFVKIKPEALK